MNKERDLVQAIADIASGSTIMVGGFMTVGTPEILVDELVRQGQENLTIVCNDAGVPGGGVGKLVRSKQLSILITSHIGLNPEMGKAMNSGEAQVQLVPQGTLAERIRCGGTGLGGFLTPTGVGTLVEEGKERKTLDGKDYLLELSLKGDVALIKAHRADRAGNLIFRMSARNFNPLMAPACQYVVAQVSEIVEIGELDPDEIMLPGIFVDALVLAPADDQTRTNETEGGAP